MRLQTPAPTAPAPILFDSCREDKFSYNIHFPAYYFADRNLLSFFASEVWKALVQTETQLFPDAAIHGQGSRQFRVAYCSKIGKPESAKIEVWGKTTFDEVTLEEFQRLLVSWKHPGVEIVSDLPGYNQECKYGQPGKNRQKNKDPSLRKQHSKQNRKQNLWELARKPNFWVTLNIFSTPVRI